MEAEVVIEKAWQSIFVGGVLFMRGPKSGGITSAYSSEHSIPCCEWSKARLSVRRYARSIYSRSWSGCVDKGFQLRASEPGAHEDIIPPKRCAYQARQGSPLLRQIFATLGMLEE